MDFVDEALAFVVLSTDYNYNLFLNESLNNIALF